MKNICCIGIIFFLLPLKNIAQSKIICEIDGNPPYAQAILRISFGSFPQSYDSVPVINGRFEFVIPDTLINKQPSYATIIVRNTAKKLEFIPLVNYIYPSRKTNYFYLGDSSLFISGKYDSSKRQQSFNLKRDTENDVYLGDFSRNLFRSGNIRSSAIDSMVSYITTYANSQCLLKEVYERRRLFSGQQLKTLVSNFSGQALSSERGKKLSIYLENKLGEETHAEYTNLELLDRNGKKTRIFDELKDANLIIFWTSWCLPCRKEVPTLLKLHEILKSKGVSFQFTHISVDAKRDLWEKADAQLSFPWRSIWSPNEQTVAAAYNYGLPSNHLVTKDKRIYRIDIRLQEGIDEIFKALGLPLEKFEYPQ
jgi:thiol-disulfide isomerase/thioredoxin